MQKKMITIVSDNEAGLILAALLERAGQSVTLIDTGDQILSKNSPNQSALPFYSNTPELSAALDAFSNLCATPDTTPVSIKATEATPLTLDSNLLVSFVGFGESKSHAVPMLSRFNANEQLIVNGSLSECLGRLRSHLKAKNYTYSELNRLEWAGDKIEKIVINGSQEVFADQFVFLISPREYLNFLNSDELGGRLRSRIAKTPVLARLTLEFQHSANIETIGSSISINRNPIFLVPNQADQEPSVGLIFSEKQSSIWETYIDNELSEDAEYVSSVMKTMKRLIRRTITNLGDKPKEFLTVTPAAAADFSWISEASDLHNLSPNLLFSPVLSENGSGLAQCIASAFSAYSKLDTVLQAELPESNSLQPPAALC